MPLPLADFDKKPVIFIDVLTPMLSDLHRAFDTLFVLTSKVVAGQTHPDVLMLLEHSGMHTVADNLHAVWATPYDADSNLEDEVEAWHATCNDRTPTSYLVVTSRKRGESLEHILKAYAVMLDGPVCHDEDYIEACRILHSQSTFEPFNSDWY
jgi:hypothetical protein